MTLSAAFLAEALVSEDFRCGACGDARRYRAYGGDGVPDLRPIAPSGSRRVGIPSRSQGRARRHACHPADYTTASLCPDLDFRMRYGYFKSHEHLLTGEHTIV